MPIRIVLADDHTMVLQGLELLLRQEPDFQVLACCRNGDETLRAVRQYRPDILILDLAMPGKDGLAVLRELQREALPTRVVLLTAALDEDDTLEALRLGVGGVVLKEMTVPLLIQCVRKVHAGDLWLEKRSISRALDKMLRREAGAREMAKVLTPREIEVIRLVANGMRNKEIAQKLAISEGTVKIHLHRSYEKLHVDNRLELLRYAQAKGLV
ncbi:MAG TPA: response regulator transcription factor [Alphaproteobacteria bacterium]|nr:response regulator transcription factor [Alphaproteobacteria bacterium]